MAFLDNFIFLSKQNSDIFYRFKKCIENVLKLQNVNKNLDLMYEFLSYEQYKLKTFKCTDYFIKNEIAQSLLKLSSDAKIESFFINIISIINKSYLNTLVNFKMLEFSDKICFTFSERLVVYDLEVEYKFLKFLNNNITNSSHIRHSLIQLFHLKNVFPKLHKLRFKQKLIKLLNSTQNENLYLEIFEIYNLYNLKKEQHKEIKPLQHKNIEENIIIVNKEEDLFVNFEDLCKNKKQIDEEEKLNLKFVSTKLFMSILKINIINDLIIDEFIRRFKNTDENIKFLYHLISKHPDLLAKKMNYESDIYNFNTYEIYNKILKNKHKTEIFSFPKIRCNKIEGNFVRILIEEKVDDLMIYLFLFHVNKKVFFKLFSQIEKLLKNNEFFYGSLYHLILKNNK